METGQHRPNAKWFRDMLSGIFMSHSLMLSEIGRTLREKDGDGKPRRLIHTEKRLSRNLLSDRFDDEAFYAAWFERVGRHLGVDDGKGVVLAIDYTDIQKPNARPDRPGGMQYVCTCRDGSARKKHGHGFPVAQFEATMPNGIRVPVLYHLFSYNDPEHVGSSEPRVFMEGMSRVAPHIGKQAWWVLDRGFQNMRFFDHMDGLRVRWATRVKIGGSVKHPQTLFLEDGTQTDVRAVASAASMSITTSRKMGRRSQRFKIGFVKVWLSNQKNRKAPVGPPRTLVVVQGRAKEPMALLASEWVGTDAHVLEVFDAYMRRWDAEEANRAMKDSRGWGIRLEDLRSLKFVGVRRLVMLAACVYLFLAEMRMAGERVVGAVVATIRCFGAAHDETYRLLRAVGAVLSRMPRWRLTEWTRGP